MASAEPRKQSGTHPLIEQAGREIRDVLAGRLRDSHLLASRERQIRQLVSAELLAATSDTDGEIQQRARQLFIDFGYFDEVARDLRDAKSASERAVAARRLGRIGTRTATTHLIAALFDSDSEVREAAGAALRQIEPGRIRDSKVDPINSLDENGSSPNVGLDRSPETLERSGDDLERLLREENSLRRALTKLEDQLLEIMTARAESEREVQLAAERELTFRGEAAVLRQEESKFRKYAEAAEARCESEKERKAASERQVQLLSEETTRLRVEADRLYRQILEGAKERAQIGAARLAESQSALLKAEEIYDSELARLKREEESLRNASKEVELRRVALERARRAIEAEARLLLDEETRVAAIESERHAEVQRLRQERKQGRAEEEKKQLADFHAFRKQRELEAQRRVEIEQRIRCEIGEMAEAEAESRRRIEQAEAQRRAAEESIRIVEEKAARLEAQARLRKAEEERALAKLETLRRTVAAELHTRSEQKHSIKEEIEQLL